MEIKLDDAKVEQAINENINKAVADSLAGYSVREAVSQKITACVANGAIAQALEAAIGQLDTETLTKHLAEQIQRATVGAVVHIIHNGLANVIVDLRKIPSYDDKAREAARMEILAMLKKA